MLDQARRVMRAQAVNPPRRLAAGCLERDPVGDAVPVKQLRAVKVLERAFTMLLWRNGKLLVLALTRFEATAFPRREATPTDPAATPWLAVWTDGQGRGIYSLRWIRIGARGKAERQTLAELVMLAAQSGEIKRQGILIGKLMVLPSCLVASGSFLGRKQTRVIHAPLCLLLRIFVYFEDNIDIVVQKQGIRT